MSPYDGAVNNGAHVMLLKAWAIWASLGIVGLIGHLDDMKPPGRWYTRISMVLEVLPSPKGRAVRLEVLYHKNWAWGVHPGPTEKLLKEMPNVDIFVWNIGLHSL